MTRQKMHTTGNGHSVGASQAEVRRFAARLYSTYALLASALEGREDAEERSRSASLLFHRLLFLYLLQQRGLLANDPCYLQHRLAQNIDEYGFYHEVLCPLFHMREQTHDFPAPLTSLFIEQESCDCSAINVPNTIFACIFAFFDEYRCYLEGGEHAGSPLALDALDELFEREISQKELGAYYTSNEITSYIARNTLLPALFTRGQGMSVLEQQLVQQPQRYLFAAARKGCELPLPSKIAAGLQAIHLRQAWQEPGLEAYALPGETWREVVARRAHLDEIIAQPGQDREVCLNRLVTWNLDQQKLALDALRNCQQPTFLEAFYRGLRDLTVLDPTCGSGAFLFAALAQLQPLYLACLTRMEELLMGCGANDLTVEQRRVWAAYLDEVGDPGQRPSAVAGWIVADNLYGVDLMAGAVELCRQRLFLNVLAARPVQPGARFAPNFGQHIHIGNSLTGSLETRHTEPARTLSLTEPRAFHWRRAFPAVMDRGGFDVVIGNPPYVEYERIKPLYTVDGYATLRTGNLYALTMERGLQLLAPGGRFGMIVPASATCTDGYRSLQQQLLAQRELHVASFSDQRGKLFNIPHPRLCIVFCEKAPPTQRRSCRVFTTAYLKLDQTRGTGFFERLHYIEVTEQARPGAIPRYSSPLESAIHSKLARQARHLGDSLQPTGAHHIYFTRKLSWYVQVTPFIPLILDEQNQQRAPSELKTLRFGSPIEAQIAFVALNSNLFYWLITTSSDCRNLNTRDVLGLPLDLASISLSLQRKFCRLASALARDLQANSEMKSMTFQKQGRLTIQCLYPARSKHLIDAIDHLLAQHYGLNAEELDFLLHYDGKYRFSSRVREHAPSIARATIVAGSAADSPSRRKAVPGPARRHL